MTNTKEKLDMVYIGVEADNLKLGNDITEFVKGYRKLSDTPIVFVTYSHLNKISLENSDSLFIIVSDVQVNKSELELHYINNLMKNLVSIDKDRFIAVNGLFAEDNLYTPIMISKNPESLNLLAEFWVSKIADIVDDTKYEICPKMPDNYKVVFDKIAPLLPISMARFNHLLSNIMHTELKYDMDYYDGKNRNSNIFEQLFLSINDIELCRLCSHMVNMSSYEEVDVELFMFAAKLFIMSAAAFNFKIPNTETTGTIIDEAIDGILVRLFELAHTEVKNYIQIIVHDAMTYNKPYQWVRSISCALIDAFISTVKYDTELSFIDVLCIGNND